MNKVIPTFILVLIMSISLIGNLMQHFNYSINKHLVTDSLRLAFKNIHMEIKENNENRENNSDELLNVINKFIKKLEESMETENDENILKDLSFLHRELNKLNPEK